MKQNERPSISGNASALRNSLPTVDELNAIQVEWMALDSTGPKAEIDRVCKLMERMPKTHVSGHDGRGVVFVHGAPLNQPMDFELCLEICKAHGGRVDIAWNGTEGKWYRVCPHCYGGHPVGCCAQDGHGG